ncbi:FAD-dependent oxidoreductase [Glycomyces sp. NPDC049804]|uniref:FAD-dependent oxidoreductase n=1 Tax=Glycomyces sp. NPDC049804 TaxID=3154363 RepID=UPI0034316C66
MSRCAQFHPAVTSLVPGLVLAGDHTRQRYLSSMQGAIVSGRLAAQAITPASPAHPRV